MNSLLRHLATALLITMKPHVMVLGVLAVAAQAVAAWAGDVTVVTTLPAHVGTNFKSNIDLSGAVGLKHVVSFNGGGFVVYDKATGKLLERLSQSEFWTTRVAASYSMDSEAKYNDPKMIYDPLSDRWFATVAPHNISYLAVSASGDPTKLWRGVILSLPTVDPGLTTGVDKHGLYVCAANGNSDPQQALDCYAIPIADATSVNGPVLTNAQSFTKLHFMAYPAMDINPHKAPDAPAILMNNCLQVGEHQARLVSLLFDLHRPFRSRSALDVPAVLRQHGRQAVVHDMGGIQGVGGGDQARRG